MLDSVHLIIKFSAANDPLTYSNKGTLHQMQEILQQENRDYHTGAGGRLATCVFPAASEDLLSVEKSTNQLGPVIHEESYVSKSPISVWGSPLGFGGLCVQANSPN